MVGEAVTNHPIIAGEDGQASISVCCSLFVFVLVSGPIITLAFKEMKMLINQHASLTVFVSTDQCDSQCLNCLWFCVGV